MTVAGQQWHYQKSIEATRSNLREELTKRNLPSKGKKDELIARLQEALDQEGSSNAEDAPKAAETQVDITESQKEENMSINEQKPTPAEIKEQVETSVDTSTAISELPEIPVVEDDSVGVQGQTEKDIEHMQEPVITKESGLVDPSANAHLMEIEEERGLKRKITESDIQDEAKRSKTETVANGQKTAEADSSATEQVGMGVRDADSTVDLKDQEKEALAAATEKDSESTAADTNAVYIKGFVRPLIQRHAEDLAKKYGNIKKFWMDNIKTHCYVIYETSQEANAAHQGIDSIVFPPDTGRTLHVGSITESKAEEMIILEKEAIEKRIKFDWELAIKELPSTIPAVAAPGESPADEPSTTIKRSRLGGIEQVAKQLQKAVADTGKLTNDSAPKSADDGLSTASLRGRVRSVKVISLDELFQKTKTLPALYYQPVSKEEALKRLELMRSKDSNGQKI
ncbi:unnamed protein product [Umbelopsis vinacea]